MVDDEYIIHYRSFITSTSQLALRRELQGGKLFDVQVDGDASVRIFAGFPVFAHEVGGTHFSRKGMGAIVLEIPHRYELHDVPGCRSPGGAGDAHVVAVELFHCREVGPPDPNAARTQ